MQTNAMHHLSDETLLDYAAGSLSVCMETLVACHLTVCPHCRERNALADEIGGEMLEVGAESRPGLSAQQLLSIARKRPDIIVSKKQKDVGDASVPRALGRLLPGPIESLEWRNVAPGVKQFPLSDQPRKEGAFKLLHLDPGITLSKHSHNEREMTYVVRGSYHDEFGHFKAGDIADLGDSHEHRPVVGDEEVCIALIATDAPVKYRSVIGKIMQPFVGI